MQNDFKTIAIQELGAKVLTLAPDDDDRRWLQENPKCYANTWLYLLRSARDDYGQRGLLISRNDYRVGLGYRNGIIYLTYPRGSAAGSGTKELCSYLQDVFDTKIVIKKVAVDLSSQLTGSQHFRQRDALANKEILEDEYHPELCVDLNVLFPEPGLINDRATNLKQKVRRFEDCGASTFDAEELRELGANFGCVSRFLAKCQAKANAYALVVEAVHSTNYSASYITSVYRKGNSVHGVYVAERLDQTVAGIYCAVTSKSAPGMTEWMDVQFFRKLHSRGIRQLLLGGCETDGVLAYCKKLLVSSPNYSTNPLVFAGNRDLLLTEFRLNSTLAVAA